MGNSDNTKVTSWCKCKPGYTGDFCEKDTRPRPCKPRRATNKKSCPAIRDKTECLESRDARTIALLGKQLKGQDCVWCIPGRNACPHGNLCEPGLWMESRGKKAGIDFEPCLK